MDASSRIVTQLPLSELWTERGEVSRDRTRELSRDAIRELFRSGPLPFVIANVGYQLRWINEQQCYRFWKDEVFPHLTEPEERIDLAKFVGEYCYLASEWIVGGRPIIVLEHQH